MRQYKDKNNNIIHDEDFVLIENEIPCQALRCDDGTLLYESLIWNYSKGKIDLADDPYYPDAYSNYEIEIISYNKVISILRKTVGD